MRFALGSDKGVLNLDLISVKNHHLLLLLRMGDPSFMSLASLLLVVAVAVIVDRQVGSSSCKLVHYGLLR